MTLKRENLSERVTKVEAEVVVLKDLAKQLVADFRIMREEFSQRFEGVDHRFERLDQKMDKILWWVLGVMGAVLMAVIFKH